MDWISELLASILLHPIALLIFGSILGYFIGALHQKGQYRRDDCKEDMDEIFYPITRQLNLLIENERIYSSHSYISYFREYPGLKTMGRLQPKRFRDFTLDMDELLHRIDMFESFQTKTFGIINRTIASDIDKQIRERSIGDKEAPVHRTFPQFSWDQLVMVLGENREELISLHVKNDKRKTVSRAKSWEVFWDEQWDLARRLCLQVERKRKEIFDQARVVQDRLLRKTESIHKDYNA